jgi:hypothetical protein
MTITGKDRVFYLRGTKNLSGDASLDVFGITVKRIEDGVYGMSFGKNSTYTIVKQGEWMNIRIETDALTNSTARLYINGELVDTYMFGDMSGIVGMQLMFSSKNSSGSIDAEVYLDNTYCGAKK